MLHFGLTIQPFILLDLTLPSVAADRIVSESSDSPEFGSRSGLQ